MSLAPGTRLGPYDIVAPLGAGGMGEVWRVRDTRLQRDVAIKVLHAGGDLKRLESEARTIAALNHPNLVAIHDIGDFDGSPYLVMELIAGKPLREQLLHGPLGTRRAIDYARQIAQGLAAAHAAGIVHRDLKPGNIMITPEGRVKILDFGLAKNVVSAAGADSDAETLAAPATRAGTVLGTAGYMAPEQVLGEAVGPAADIFAFGSILYEMLSGRRAFSAATTVEAMAAILNQDPPELAATLPPPLDRIVRRCLEKSPPQRFQSAADLDFALSGLAETSSTSLRPAAAAAVRAHFRWRTPVIAAITAVIAVAVCLLFTLDRRTPAITESQVRTIALNADRAGGFWSPDGKSLAYAAAPVPGEPEQIYLYLLGGGQPLQLTHEPDSLAPVGWSTSGQRRKSTR